MGPMIGFDRLPWYHKLWFIPFVLVCLLVSGICDDIRSWFKR